MGLDIAVVNLKFLERPKGVAYDFAFTLAADCKSSGGGNAMVFYLRGELLHEASHYIDQNDLEMNVQAEILDWVESLPFNRHQHIINQFISR